jgi:uncharacterized protein YchJ
MSDSRGMSMKAIEKNALKLTAPSYVSRRKIQPIIAEHKNGKHRNELCVCGSGKKHKRCCGK